MWSLALAALAALVVSVDCKCLKVFEPLNKTMRRLEFNGSRSWLEVDSMCKEQFPGGFEMLKRDFLGLSEADRALCRGQAVPLGLKKTGPKPIVWPKSEHLRYEEEVNSTYLTRKRGAETLNETAHAQVGSLDLTTNQWRLVDNDTSFTCAICQRAWVDSLDRLEVDVPRRAGELPWAFTFRLVKTGSDDVTVDEALRLAVDNLNQTVTSVYLNGIRAEFEKLASSDSGGHGNRGTSVRVRSRVFWLEADDVTKALNGSYAIESWWDADFCPPTRYQGIDWEQTFRGDVGRARLPEFHLASRRCWIRMRGEDGDYDAAWDEEVFLWMDHGGKCKGRHH